MSDENHTLSSLEPFPNFKLTTPPPHLKVLLPLKPTNKYRYLYSLNLPSHQIDTKRSTNLTYRDPIILSRKCLKIKLL